jgi:hypothetical protein
MGGKAYMIKLNYSDLSMENETEIDLGMDNCFNIAINKNGSIAVVAGFNN